MALWPSPSSAIPADPERASLLLAWPTAGRRDCLAASVESLAANAAAYGRSVPLLLVSDSDGEALAPALRRQAEETARRYGFPLEILGLRSREALFAELGRDFDRELLEYAFLPSPDGPGWGCNVNLAFLKAAGRLLVSTDDDVQCRPAVPRGEGREFASCPDPVFTRDFYPWDILFYSDRGSLLDAMEGIEADVLGRYIGVLGREGEELLGLEAGASESAAAGGRILVASPGMYGDSAMGRGIVALELEGRSREHMLSAGYEELRYSREIARIAPRITLSRGVQLVMTQTGFDCRPPLPPFLPFGRNPDGMCALLARILYPRSLTAYLDFGLLHSPPEARLARPEDLYSFAPTLAALIMSVAVANRSAPSTADPAEGFAALGSAIAEAASSGASAFVDLVYAIWAEGAQARAERMEALLENFGGKPSLWAEDVRRHLDDIDARLAEPASLFGRNGCGLSVAQAMGHFERYGRLLAIWPALHARAARANGST